MHQNPTLLAVMFALLGEANARLERAITENGSDVHVVVAQDEERYTYSDDITL